MTDIRWHQRLDNFDRALSLLHEALTAKTLDGYSALEREGIIQRFKFTFKLAWKTMKDYLENEGAMVEPATPRNVIKQAFAARIVPDGQLWIDMMLHRNLLSHSYDEKRFLEVLKAARERYLNALVGLRDWLLARKAEG
ncbi:MAG: nucleotidyltransferase substrate binding protein [Desulfovibrionaceae bacterium]